MECSTDFLAQRGHRKLRTTYLNKELARVVVTVRMPLSVVFLQQALLSRMRALLKTFALLFSLRDSWERVEMTQYRRRPSDSGSWKASGLRRIAGGGRVETVRRKAQTDALANGKWWMNETLHGTTATLCTCLGAVLYCSSTVLCRAVWLCNGCTVLW